MDQRFPVLPSRNRNSETLGSSLVSESVSESILGLCRTRNRSRNRNLDTPSLGIGTGIEIQTLPVSESEPESKFWLQILFIQFLLFLPFKQCKKVPILLQKWSLVPESDSKSEIPSSGLGISLGIGIEFQVCSVSEPESESSSRHVRSRNRNRNRVLDWDSLRTGIGTGLQDQTVSEPESESKKLEPGISATLIREVRVIQ